MAEIQLGVVEARYADIIWEHEPVSSSELVKLTEEAFHSVSYTHLVVSSRSPSVESTVILPWWEYLKKARRM